MTAAAGVRHAALGLRGRLLLSIDRRLWLWVLAGYLLCRLFSVALIVWMAPHDGQAVVAYRSSTGPLGYWDVVHSWDGKWYEQIIREGYPRDLPHRADGAVDQSTWAFLPLYSILVKTLMSLTGLPFGVAGSLLSLACGAAACCVMAVLLRERIGAGGALAGTVLFSASPPSPILQMTYTESLGLLLACLFLWAVTRERWIEAIGAAIFLGFERPIALPLAGVMAAVLLRMILRRKQLRPSRGSIAGAVLTFVATIASGLAWPAVAAWVTGVPTAYTQTQAAWRTGKVVPFQPWLTNFNILFGEDRGVFVLFVLVAMVFLVMLGPWGRDLGFVLRAWMVSYAVYLLAVVDVWTSTYRFLLFLWPIAPILVGAAHRRSPDRTLVGLRTVLLTGLFLAWQVWWVWELLRFTPPADFAP